MTFYMDDNRLAAFAITEIAKEKTPTLRVYHDLLGGKLDVWVGILENIDITQNWCLNKQLELDALGSDIWSIGDNVALERGAWKYGIY